jgi:hypothetical protein
MYFSVVNATARDHVLAQCINSSNLKKCERGALMPNTEDAMRRDERVYFVGNLFLPCKP